MEENEQTSQEETEVREEDEELRELFQAQTESVMTTEKNHIGGKRKTDESKLSEEIKQNPNRIMANHLRDKNSLPEITDVVYAMARAEKMRETSTRKHMRDQNTKGKHQQ